MRLSIARTCFKGLVFVLSGILACGQAVTESGAVNRSELVVLEKEKRASPDSAIAEPILITFSKFPALRGRSINIAAKAPQAARFDATVYDENNFVCIVFEGKTTKADEWWSERSRILTDRDNATQLSVNVSVKFEGTTHHRDRGESPVGTVVLVSQDAPNDLASNSDTRFDPNPASPPRDQQGVFTFWLDVAADVTGEIFPEGKKKPIAVFIAPDLPKGTNQYRWNLRRTPQGSFVEKGLYVARFRCKSRDPNKPQHDFCVVLKIA